MQTFRVETKIEETGRLSLSQLPFTAGDEVEVVVRRRSTGSRPREPGEPLRHDRASDLPPGGGREVVAADRNAKQGIHIFSPRLAHPEDASDFKKEIIEILGDAEI